MNPSPAPVPLTDPYFSTQRCVERLISQYGRTPKLIIATDYDSTVFDFHQEGHSFPLVVQLLRECQDLGFYIVVFTASAKVRHPEIRRHMEDGLGIRVASINENPVPLPYGNEGKVFYNLLLDDRSGLLQAYIILRRVVDQIKDGGRIPWIGAGHPAVIGRSLFSSLPGCDAPILVSGAAPQPIFTRPFVDSDFAGHL